MKKIIKKFKWLIEHQEEIENLIINKKPTNDLNDGTFSLAGVPEYQKKYIEGLLSKK